MGSFGNHNIYNDSEIIATGKTLVTKMKAAMFQRRRTKGIHVVPEISNKGRNYGYTPTKF